jgi:hypothetical protein
MDGAGTSPQTSCSATSHRRAESEITFDSPCARRHCDVPARWRSHEPSKRALPIRRLVLFADMSFMGGAKGQVCYGWRYASPPPS